MKLNNLGTKFLGKNIYYYESIDSTQSEVWRLYEENASNVCLVVAQLQTHGVGTHGRVWRTDEKNNIAFSFLVKTDCNIKILDGITLKIAEIITKIFKDMYNIELSIKEPNDIIYKDKKIGGILTQTKVNKENVRAIVIGIGINTNQKEFCDEIKDIASSIKREFNVEVKTDEFIRIFLEEFEKELIERKIVR